MIAEQIPLIGSYWAPVLETINRVLEKTGSPTATVEMPLYSIVALLLLWMLIRLVRSRRSQRSDLIEDLIQDSLQDGESPAPAAEVSQTGEPTKPLFDPDPDLSPDEEPDVDFMVETESLEGQPDQMVSEPGIGDEQSTPTGFEAIEPLTPVTEPIDAKPAEVEVPELLVEQVAEEVSEEPKVSWFQRLKQGLDKTRGGFVGRIETLLSGRTKIDDDLYNDLEEALVTSDIGVKTAYQLLERTQARIKEEQITTPKKIMDVLRDEIKAILDIDAKSFDVTSASPYVLMVVGVNGTGKTTTIGKMASYYANQDRKVLMAAADTFRAAAIEQLEVWSQRVGCDIIKQKQGADPSAVAFDALDAAQARSADMVIIDTAGRLHTKTNLMKELGKVKRVIQKKQPDAPHEILLVLDATTGQNAINQAREFNQATELTGIIMTKLDGTAKGGCIVGIADEFKLPIRFIGIGEKIDDLRPFDADEFVNALF